MSFYILETLDHAIYRVRFHLLPTTLDRRGRKIIWILQLNNADGVSRTWAASTASERTILYTNASRHQSQVKIGPKRRKKGSLILAPEKMDCLFPFLISNFFWHPALLMRTEDEWQRNEIKKIGAWLKMRTKKKLSPVYEFRVYVGGLIGLHQLEWVTIMTS